MTIQRKERHLVYNQETNIQNIGTFQWNELRTWPVAGGVTLKLKEKGRMCVLTYTFLLIFIKLHF